MPLAIFDLDNTLIAGDSDHGWGEFLAAHNMVDAAYYKRMNDHFYQDYQNGKLDMSAYLEFSLAPLAKLDPSALTKLHAQFMVDVIEPMWLPKAEQLLQQHRDNSDTLMVITSTNRFVVEPICKKLGIDYLIATELEQHNNRYTGNVSGIPSYKEGKVTRLISWLAQTDLNMDGSSFYSDSINDLPLLEIVEHPVAVDPCDQLRAVATERSWRIISLRD
jgi:HAD superfamily hydrolase (TIGR01490 family)|tara:strand:- start:51532 stop:52188 length:657 start_codon:yes stop_codon:yes gene_type:complete